MLDEEPFDLDFLEEYQCRKQILADHFAGRKANRLEQWQGSGLLPHGVTGSGIAFDLLAETQEVIDAMRPSPGRGAENAAAPGPNWKAYH